MSRRTDQVGDLLRSEISTLLLREISDPRIRLATVTLVDVSPDLRHARALVSVVGDARARAEAIDALAHAAAYLRRLLAVRLRSLRRIPELTFELDRGAEFAERIESLLEEEDHDPST